MRQWAKAHRARQNQQNLGVCARHGSPVLIQFPSVLFRESRNRLNFKISFPI
jgi:hypothetical protein